jgi:hypothetical protein
MSSTTSSTGDYFRSKKVVDVSNATPAIKAKAMGRAFTPGTMSDISTTPSTPLDSLFGTRANTPHESLSSASSVSESERISAAIPKGSIIEEEDRAKIDVSTQHNFPGGNNH